MIGEIVLRPHRAARPILATIVSTALSIWITCPVTAAIPAVTSPHEVGARVVWQLSMPLRSIDSITEYHLVDEFLVAIASDGKVRVFRADNGADLWTRQLVEAGSTIWPPVILRNGGGTKFVFATPTQVLFLDPSNGYPQDRLRTRYPSTGPVAVSDESVFVCGVDRRLRNYHIPDHREEWSVSSTTALALPPLYLETKDVLLFSNAAGELFAGTVEKKKKVFAAQLEGEPRGWLSASTDTAYVATTEEFIYGLDLQTGAKRFKHRLPGWPRGGPVVTKSGVYQATVNGGLQRFGLKGEGTSWNAREARQFLAEWSDHTVLLLDDGRIGLVNAADGETSKILDLGSAFSIGMSNPRNDAVIVATARGEVRCLRPMDTGPLTGEDFRPPASASPRQAAAEKSPAPEEGEENSPDHQEPGEEQTASATESPPEFRYDDPLRSTRTTNR